MSNHTIFAILFSLVFALPVQAQITADQTLLTPSRTIDRHNRTIITGGTAAGSNLFHSFRDFSVSRGRIASFQPVDPAIANIITRVTGRSVSRIDGTIEALDPAGRVSPANLFLINPNGIIFGREAALNLGGSFLATTGDRLLFADGAEFRADGTQTSSLLTVSTPVGLQMGVAPAAIVNRSRQGLQFSRDLAQDPIAGGLQVVPGRTLALIGGEIRVPGGVLLAESGHLELGAIATGTSTPIRLLTTVNGWRFTYPHRRNFANVSLSQSANLSVSGAAGGSMQLQGQQITVTDASFLTVLTRGNQTRGNQTRGNQRRNENPVAIDIRAQYLNLRDRSFLRTLTQGNENGGDIAITVDRLQVETGGVIASNTNGSGNGGRISIEARDSITLDGYRIQTLANGDSIFFGTGIASQARSPNNLEAGNGGRIQLTTRSLRILDGAQINASTFGAGNAGHIQVEADSIDLRGVARYADGEVVPTPDNRVYPSGLFTGTRENAQGRGGAIQLDTDRLRVLAGAAIKTNTEGSGDSGQLTIRSTDQIIVSGIALGTTTPALILTASGGVPGIDASGVATATGRGGNLQLQTRALQVSQGGAIAVGSLNPNPQVAEGAGNLRITAHTIQLRDRGRLLAETASGDGGNLQIQSANLVLLQQQSQISTTAGRDRTGGNGGNMTLNSRFITAAAVENSDITANAFVGNGGTIQINAIGILGILPRSTLTAQSDITASSEFGLSGTIDINGSTIDPGRELAALPTDPLRVYLDQRCRSHTTTATTMSRFVETGRSGLPASLTEADRSQSTWDDLRLPSYSHPTAPQQQTIDRATPMIATRSTEATTFQPMTQPMTQPIIEAQGWRKTADGQIVLMAEAPATLPYSSWRSPQHCQG